MSQSFTRATLRDGQRECECKDQVCSEEAPITVRAFAVVKNQDTKELDETVKSNILEDAERSDQCCPALTHQARDTGNIKHFGGKRCGHGGFGL